MMWRGQIRPVEKSEGVKGSHVMWNLEEANRRVPGICGNRLIGPGTRLAGEKCSMGGRRQAEENGTEIWQKRSLKMIEMLQNETSINVIIYALRNI